MMFAEIAETQSLTGGNPFLAGEFAQALLDRRAGLEPDHVTPGTRDAVAARLARLSPPSAAAVRAAIRRPPHPEHRS